ncbi:MAG: hypothetical protein Q8Q33_07495 [Chlamydiota bacterium]|nr:hypothetical protein [Chlamydiota bacterium]
MSIILNALKKAEKNGVILRDSPRSEAPVKKKKPLSVIYVIFAIILGIASVIAINILTLAFSDMLREKRSSSNSQILSNVIAKETAVIQSVNVLPDFELNGIMMGPPPQALIDGYFLEVGDEFKGIQIIQINPSYIVLLYDNKQFKKQLK